VSEKQAKKSKSSRCMAQVIEYLPSNQEALNSVSNTAKKLTGFHLDSGKLILKVIRREHAHE
jgi:hypothetical protein